MSKIRFVFIVSMLFAGTPLLCMNSSVKSNDTEIIKKDVGEKKNEPVLIVMNLKQVL